MGKEGNMLGIGVPELIVIFVIVFVIGASIYAVYRYAKRHLPSKQTPGPAGVGGWLLLLVTGLMIFGPLIGAAGLNFEIMSAESQYPNLTTLASWRTFKSVTWGTYLVIACLSFYAGLGLARDRDMSVVRRAKLLLWVIGPVASLVMGIVIPLLVFGELKSGPQLIGNFITAVIVAGIWTTYLSKSKRVETTYGGEVSNNNI